MAVVSSPPEYAKITFSFMRYSPFCYVYLIRLLTGSLTKDNIQQKMHKRK